MTVEAPGRDVVAVQMLRAIAATMVLFVHMDHQLDRLHYGTFGTGWMASGVDVFFVISGFIMWTSVERRGGMTAGAFLKNRLIRIVPLYWFVTTIVLLVGLTIPHVMSTTTIQPAHVLASYLFLPARHPVTGDFWPLVIPGWSLNYEMLFYVVFAVAIALSAGARTLRFALICGLLAAVMLIGYLTRSRVDVMNFYASPLLIEFVAGVALGIIWRTGRVARSWLWLVPVLLGFPCLWEAVRFDGGFALKILAATMIVGGAVFLPPLRHNPLSSLGDASYSLYLTHAITLSALALLWGHYFRQFGWQLFVLAGLAAAVMVAVLMYNYFEVPMTAALKRLSFQPRFARIPPPAPSAVSPEDA